MISEKVKVGVIAPSLETRKLLSNQVSVTGLADVITEVDQYFRKENGLTRRFFEMQPDIILVDMEDPEAATQTLETLHLALPKSWLVVSSEKNEPQLIIQAMRAGAREFLPQPIAPENLVQTLKRYIAERQHNGKRKKAGKIYCVMAAKGGTGATTVAINLAAVVATEKKNAVALIDLHCPIGDVAAYLDVKSAFTAFDAFAESSRLDEVLLQTYVKDCHGFAVLPGLKDFLPGQMPGADALATTLEVITQVYTHAFVDLPVSFDEELLEVATEMSEAIVVVLTPEFPAIWRTNRLLSFLRKSVNPQKLRLVVNRFGSRTYPISNSNIEKALSRNIFWKLPNDYSPSIEAVRLGKPLVSINHSRLGRSYQELAYRLTGTPVPKKRRGLFG